LTVFVEPTLFTVVDNVGVGVRYLQPPSELFAVLVTLSSLEELHF